MESFHIAFEHLCDSQEQTQGRTMCSCSDDTAMFIGRGVSWRKGAR